MFPSQFTNAPINVMPPVGGGGEAGLYIGFSHGMLALGRDVSQPSVSQGSGHLVSQLQICPKSSVACAVML